MLRIKVEARSGLIGTWEFRAYFPDIPWNGCEGYGNTKAMAVAHLFISCRENEAVNKLVDQYLKDGWEID